MRDPVTIVALARDRSTARKTGTRVAPARAEDRAIKGRKCGASSR